MICPAWCSECCTAQCTSRTARSMPCHKRRASIGPRFSRVPSCFLFSQIADSGNQPNLISRLNVHFVDQQTDFAFRVPDFLRRLHGCGGLHFTWSDDEDDVIRSAVSIQLLDY